METPLYCELHAHSMWSDGSLDLKQVVDLYGGRGFDVLCTPTMSSAVTTC